MKHLPEAWCVKCNKPAKLERRVVKGKRVLHAVCHKQKQKIDFVDEPGKVEVFND